MQQKRDSIVLHGVKRLAGALQTAKSGMLKVQHDPNTRQSRTSLASIFEDLASIRKSILGKRSKEVTSQRSWIEKTFQKRECAKFIRSHRDPGKCCCGRPEAWEGHYHTPRDTPPDGRWHPYRHTDAKATDAYGCIEFQGAPHPSKAQYVRLSSYDSKTDQVLQLLQDHWGLELPKLLITVHGGILNFDLQPKLKRVFRKGLLKAAKTTGAWIITSGTNTGVTRHVGDAISDRTLKAKNKIIAIGIAPWGIVENKDDLIGKDAIVPYHCVSSPKTNYSVLNNNHSYFLLVDNGTVGKYGGEIIFRKRLEKYIAHQKIWISNGVKGRGVPVICVVLEGGANTIRSVLEYVTDTPPVPVVVCDGSGRAADLLAFTHKFSLDDGTMPESLRDQLILTIQKSFQYSPEQAEKLFIELMLCVKKKELITVFRMGEGAQDIDLAILTALLKGTNASAPDQLSLALTWDRVDIARSHIFVYGQEWPEGSLEQAMMDALINDRVDFVKLLLENGVHMQSFLTIPRLEELYNTRQGPSNTLRYLVRDVRKHFPQGYRYTIPDIGLVLQHLMGGAFRAQYCRKRFRQRYNALKRNNTSSGLLGQIVTMVPAAIIDTKPAEDLFPYPFHDLMMWAVLMKRQKMALFTWQHGEEALAKALMACKLYKAMAHEADQDDLEIEIPDEIRRYANEFQNLALELLEHCYKIDDDYTQQLLTYELKNFSDQTCLSLGVAANHREFIAHTCCQMLLNDMWMGGLRMRKSTSFKVLFGILIPPYIVFLEFKSKEELQLMPQTMEEHLEELEGSVSEADSFSVSSIDEDPNDYMDEIESSFTSQAQMNVKENGAVIVDTSIYSNQVIKKRKSPLRLGKKIYEFYNAPITKFWQHTLSYFVFLVLYTYIVLARTPDIPCGQEYYVMVYIATIALEKLRQIIVSEPTRLVMKVKVYFGSLWNIWDTVAIFMFLSAVVVRHCPITPKAARMIYAVNIVFWYIRVLEILSVNKYLGPYVKIIGKLLRDMLYFIVILLIVVASFGVVRQSVHYQDKDWSWFLVRSMFFYPYWMIYGELFADEIDTCTDPDHSCVYGSWISPLLMFAFLLVSNILLVNLLIARFNATFIRNNKNSREIWKFQRYQLIVNYELRPILAPPFIIISHIFLIIKFIKRRCQGKQDTLDTGLKLFLSHDDMEKLHDFEEECVEDYFREKEHQLMSSSDKRIQVINERVENMSLRMEDRNQRENSIKLSLQTMDYRMSVIEEIAVQTTDTLKQMRRFMSQFDMRTRHRSVSSDHSASLRGRVGSEESLAEQADMQQYDDYASSHSDQMSGRFRDRDGSSAVDDDNSAATETSSTMRNMPSPLLVHSRKVMREDSLHKYTDFTKPPAIKMGLPLKRQSSIKQRSSLPKVVESSPETVRAPLALFADNSLSQDERTSSLSRRRHASNLHINTHMDAVTVQESVVCETLDSDVTSPNNNTAIYSTAHMRAGTSVSSQQLAVQLEGDDTINQSFNATNNRMRPHELLPIEIPSSPGSVQQYVSGGYTDMVPAAYITPFTPILTSITAEYTTITDEIDTTCMITRTPPRSPTTASAYFGESIWDSADMKPENQAAKSEKATLKQAEEIEHKKMATVIRHRLRQISMDENDGISDIAKMVISEMDMTDEVHSDHEEEEEDMHASMDCLQQPGGTSPCAVLDLEEDSGPIMFKTVQIRIRQPSQDAESLSQSTKC